MSDRNDAAENKKAEEIEKIDIINIVADFLYGLKKLWLVIVILIIVCALRSYFATSFSYTPQYVASATMSVTTSSGGGSYMDTESAQQMAEVFPYVLTSGVLEDVVAEAMGMDYLPGSISVQAEEGTNLLTMSASADDPQVAYNLLHAVIDNYPQVGEFVFGETRLEILDETGIPSDVQREEVIRGSYKRGALQGAIIGFAILCIYVFAHRTVKSKDKLKRQVNLRDLGSLPFVRIKKRRKQQEHSLCILDERTSFTYLEAVRKLRIRVLKELEEKKIKSILVTSSIPGEGKTTISANLAIALARQGKKVILVDCDPRNPSVAEIFGEEQEHPGIGAVLRGEVKISDAFTSVQVGDDCYLNVVFGGEPNKEDALLLGRKQMKAFIESAKKEADVVILDTAPAELLVDASLMARYVDAALYVVRYDYTKMNRIRAGIQSLSMSGIHMLGFVFNGDRSAKEKRYGYGYSYGYNRYGSYGHYGHYGRYGRLKDTGKMEDEFGRVIKE